MEEEMNHSVNQEQVHDLLFGRELGWQEIIYDLINTEQLNPWDIDITILTNKYLVKIEQLEQADFFVSSKVLLAASLLLRIKSEILLNRYIKSIDDILFGNNEEKKSFEKLELEGELPELIPRSPMPRFKRVTLPELMEALNKAITTENRRIRKEIINRNALRESTISLPKRTINIKDKIKNIHTKLVDHFETKQTKKVTYTEFIGEDKEERVLSFYPLLQLESNNKVWMEQPQHFEEIDLWLKKVYLKENGDPFAGIKKELNELEEQELRDAEIEEVEEKLEEQSD
jgi:segregation and condensation protein A